MFLIRKEARMGKNQHVVPRSEHLWAVLGEGNTRDTSHHSTQKAAMQVARKIAMNQKKRDDCA